VKPSRFLSLVGDLEFVELLTIAQVRLLLGWRNEPGFLAEVGPGLGVPVPVLPHQSEANRRIREQPTGVAAQARARGVVFFLEQGPTPAAASCHFAPGAAAG